MQVQQIFQHFDQQKRKYFRQNNVIKANKARSIFIRWLPYKIIYLFHKDAKWNDEINGTKVTL